MLAGRIRTCASAVVALARSTADRASSDVAQNVDGIARLLAAVRGVAVTVVIAGSAYNQEKVESEGE